MQYRWRCIDLEAEMLNNMKLAMQSQYIYYSTVSLNPFALIDYQVLIIVIDVQVEVVELCDT